MTRSVIVVPHTHWDREWYMPLELFRWRLTRMVDALLDHLESHPEYPCFNLDGQSIVIDDYLALRPEARERLTRLIAEGRIVIGPWWVQPDEWLPSAESHIRNLQLGIREAEKLGGCMMIGHCADQFGHIAQLPQIFSQLELTSACLWRGVSDEVPGWSFWWEAPDGTRLPVLYLRQGYGNGVNLPAEPGELNQRIQAAEEDRRDDEPALLMNGGDHTFFEPDVPAYLLGAGEGYRPEIGTLVDYQRAMFAAGIDEYVHTGELRSTNRSNILVGVLSARMNIKQRDFEASAALERYAEPLEFLANLTSRYDGLAALKFAWRILLENAPHDSICGCSIDQTHREMMPRFDRAEQLATQVVEESVASLLPKLATGTGAIAFWRPATGQPTPVSVPVPGDWAMNAVTVGGFTIPVARGELRRKELLSNRTMTVAAAIQHLDGATRGTVHGRRVQSVSLEDSAEGFVMAMTVGNGFSQTDFAGVRERLRAAVDDPRPVQYTIHTESTVELSMVLPPTDQMELAVAIGSPSAAPVAGTAVALADSVANEYFRVRLNGDSLEVGDLSDGTTYDGLNAYAAEGDRGDEYNADITGSIVSSIRSELESVEADGVRATLTYRTLLNVTQSLSADRERREGSATIALRTAVTLWAGVRRLDFATEVENGAADMRLRTLFPLPFQPSQVATEGHFYVNRRSLEPEPWNGTSAERPQPTFPQKTFAAMEGDGRGVAVFNRGLPEGEVVGATGRQSYALTLLRAVGWLSRPDLVTRDGGAGPTIRTLDSQMPGTSEFEYAWTSYSGTWQDAEIQSMAHAYAFPPMAWAVSGFTGEAERLPTLKLDGAVFSALHRSHADGTPIVRLYRGSDEAGEVAVELPMEVAGVQGTNLLERRGTPLVLSGPGTWTRFASRLGDSELWRRSLRMLEAPTGIEPVIKVLQTSALPLGHGAVLVTWCPGRDLNSHAQKSTAPSRQRVCRSTTWALGDYPIAAIAVRP